MKVLFVFDQELQAGNGTALRIRQLLEGIPADWSVTIAARNPPQSFAGHPCVAVYWQKLDRLATAHDAVVINLSSHAHWMERLLRSKRPILLDAYNLFFMELQFLSDCFPIPTNKLRTFLTRGQAHYELRHAHAILVSHPQQAAYVKQLGVQAPIHLLPIRMPDVQGESPATPPPSLAQLILNHPTFTLGGGLWPWYDYDTLFAALHYAHNQNPTLRLIIHTSPLHSDFQKVLLDFIAQDSVLSAVIHIQHQWLTLPQRLWVLQNVRALVNCQPMSAETTYSYRTRIFDALHAGLPIIGTAGDYLSAQIATHKCGTILPYGDAPAMGAALVQHASAPRIQPGSDAACTQLLTLLDFDPNTLTEIFHAFAQLTPEDKPLARLKALPWTLPSFVLTRYVSATYKTNWGQWIKNHIHLGRK